MTGKRLCMLFEHNFETFSEHDWKKIMLFEHNFEQIYPEQLDYDEELLKKNS